MTNLETEYAWRYDNILAPTAERLHQLMDQYFSCLPRIDRIAVRPKGISRFIAKAAKVDSGKPKYSDPLKQIQDQIAARVVTFYTPDVATVTDQVRRFFRPVEQKNIVPDSVKEFGYVGTHFILLLPDDVIDNINDRSRSPQFFELQVKTLFQHAWSEAEHDLNYKTTVPLSAEQQRHIAFTAAQAWGADRTFADLFSQAQLAANGPDRQ